MRRARPLLSAELVLFLGLLALVGVGYLAERWLFGGESAPIGVAAALGIAAAPGGIWFLALRAHERELLSAHERELASSQRAVAALFGLGVFVVGPVAYFAIELALAEPPLAAPRPSTLRPARIVAAFGVVGLGYETAKYLAIRYTTYRHESRDPITLFVGATAVALGVAAHDVYRELTALGAIPLGDGILRAAAVPLVHAASAAATACALIALRTRSWSGSRRTGVVLAGVAAAALAHGSFDLVYAAIEDGGLRAHPGRAAASLALAAPVLLVALTLFAAWLCPPAESEPTGRGGGTRVGS